jgi:hypothetical protein
MRRNACDLTDLAVLASLVQIEAVAELLGLGSDHRVAMSVRALTGRWPDEVEGRDPICDWRRITAETLAALDSAELLTPDLEPDEVQLRRFLRAAAVLDELGKEADDAR